MDKKIKYKVEAHGDKVWIVQIRADSSDGSIVFSKKSLRKEKIWIKEKGDISTFHIANVQYFDPMPRVTAKKLLNDVTLKLKKNYRRILK